MMRVRNLVIVSLTLLIFVAIDRTSSADFSSAFSYSGSPAPGLESYTLYMGGALEFSDLTINGLVHQVNMNFGPIIPTLFPEDISYSHYPDAKVCDTHFLFAKNTLLSNGADFIGYESNDGSNPASLNYFTLAPYNQAGLGVFDCTGGVIAFDELLPDYTPFMQIVVPTGTMISLECNVSDGDVTFPFSTFPALYCGSDISTSPANGGTLEFDLARVGTTVTAPLVIEDANGCPICPSWGVFPSANGEFGPNFKLYTGLLNEDVSESRIYTYTPNERGADTQMLVAKSDGPSGGFNSDSEITLSGTGVGPVFENSITPGGAIDFGDVQVDSFFDISFDIENNTTDGDLGELTDLTLLWAEISGADADMFSLVDFVPGTVLSALDMESILVRFNTSESDTGYRSATLTITTDQGAAFGAAGDQFVFPLVATVVPEPSGLLLLALGATVLVGYTRWRKA